MKREFVCWVAAAILLSSINRPLRADDREPIPGLGPVGKVEKVRGDFQFTEGPAWDGAGNLYFSDIPANRIYRLDNKGEISVFLEPSGHTNGLMCRGKGTIVACQMDGQIVEIDVATKKITPIAAEHQGKRFNAPNDLVFDQHGGVYFTDPRFRAPEPWPQGKEAFYYASADGKVTRLGDDLPAPNGVILSPDEKTLYVIPSMQKKMMAYDVLGPGKLSDGRVFCELKQPAGSPEGPGGGGDGLAIDTKGNLYITSRLGIQVFNPEGSLLGIIEFPEQPANVTFGGEDLKTLYVTARTGLYSAKMAAQGHVFPGAK
ncbi:MAG: SMP-30/gluconolactonase/LRE family protein [Planctomycetales bacterium]|nr:SMP-30/gluconolactonase/LRE family protein [Planctomycetales bacterium]